MRGGMGSNRPMSPYEEEEEGYVSGDYDDQPFFELSKIRVKLHYADDVHGMTITPELSWEDFRSRIALKFNKDADRLGMKFRDEDGGRVTLRDDSDFELAIETVREVARGKPGGKLEVWVVDE